MRLKLENYVGPVPTYCAAVHRAIRKQVPILNSN